jgi:hypothetical protein
LRGCFVGRLDVSDRLATAGKDVESMCFDTLGTGRKETNPMPLAAPVTRITLPSNSLAMVVLIVAGTVDEALLLLLLLLLVDGEDG